MTMMSVLASGGYTPQLRTVTITSDQTWTAPTTLTSTTLTVLLVGGGGGGMPMPQSTRSGKPVRRNDDIDDIIDNIHLENINNLNIEVSYIIGNRLFTTEKIKEFVPCDDEAFGAGLHIGYDFTDIIGLEYGVDF